MNRGKSKRKNDQYIVTRSRRYKILMSLGMVTMIFVALPIVVLQSVIAPHHLGNFLFAGMMIIAMIPSLYSFYVQVFKTRIIIDDEGLRITGFYHVSASWDEMLKFGSNRSAWGIYTVNDVRDNRSMWKSKLSKNFIPLSHIIGMPTPKKVFLLIFRVGVNLKLFATTEIGQEIYKHAPHLFEEYDEWKPKKLKADDNHAIVAEEDKYKRDHIR